MKTRIIDIRSFIAPGKSNAVKRETLRMMMYLCDRDVRTVIWSARCNGIPVINLSDGRGYMICTDDDLDDELAFIKQEESRISNELKALRGIKEHYDCACLVKMMKK